MDDTLDILKYTSICHTRTYMHHAHIHLYTYTLTRHHSCLDKLCSSPQLSTNSYIHSPTTQTRFIWKGELGREADLPERCSKPQLSTFVHTINTCTYTNTLTHIHHHCCCDLIGYVAVHYSTTNCAPTTWTWFVWGGEHHVDEVHLERRGREADLADRQ